MINLYMDSFVKMITKSFDIMCSSSKGRCKCKCSVCECYVNDVDNYEGDANDNVLIVSDVPTLPVHVVTNKG